MTVQPTLFTADDDTMRRRCWRCRRNTTHEILGTYATRQQLVRCTQCNAGGITRVP